MSSQILYVNPEEIDTIEKRRKYTVNIVGCGQIGILHACLFADAGFKVECADPNQTVINQLIRGRIPFLKREIEFKLKNYMKTGVLEAATDVKSAVSKSDINIVTIPIEIDDKGKVDYSHLENVIKQVGAGLRRNSLVVIMNTVGVGIIQGLIKEILENTSGFKVGTDFGLAYSPIQISNAQTPETIANQNRIVAAADKNSLNAASTVLGVAAKNLKKTQDVKTAEAVTLFESVQRDANNALAIEFAVFCEKIGVSYYNAQNLVTVDHSPALSTPAFIEEDSRKKSSLLLEESENLNLKLRIPTVAMEVNEEAVKHAINLTRDALKNCGKPLRRAKISLFGISQVPNTRAAPKKASETLAKMLEAKGAKIFLYDPYFPSDMPTEGQTRLKRNLSEALEGSDCILLLTGHDQFKRSNLKKIKAVMKMPAAIVDLEGIFEPGKVEKEGFIYRGLGRGI